MFRAAALAAVLLPFGTGHLDAQAPRRSSAAVPSRGAEIHIVLPETVRGGETVAGSLTLPRSAPAGGLRVTLTSSHPGVATVSEAVTVPAFRREAVISVTAAARRGETAQTVTISAQAGGVSAARGRRDMVVTQAAAARSVAAGPPASPASALSEAAKTAVQSRLEPAPPVTGWQPMAQAPEGSRIVIDGSGFRPGDVAVRIGTRSLELLEATPTRLVARAPGSNDPGILDPFIAGPLSVAHAGGQARILEAAYRIADRWQGYTPVAGSVVQSGELALLDLVTERRWVATFDVVIAGLPGDEIVGHAGSPPQGGCGQQLYHLNPAPVSGGNVALSVRMSFHFGAQHCDRLTLPLRVRYRDRPDDVQTVVIALGGATLRTIIRVENTQELLDAGVLEFTSRGGSGTCAGQVDGMTVGRFVTDGDVAFRLHDALTSARCKWTLAQSAEPDAWILRDNGWTIHQLGWTPSRSPQGQRCGPVRKSGGSELGMFTFDRGEVYMGWDVRRMAPDSAMHVLLACMAAAQAPFVIGIAPDAPHHVTARLDWVELLAPAGAVRWEELTE
jgi:hypothetical protein